MPMEWNVPSQGIPSAAPPRSWPTRSFISRAALLVKVTARISFGRARCVHSRCAMRVVSTRVLPVPAPASTSTGPSSALDSLALLGVQTLQIRRLGGKSLRSGDLLGNGATRSHGTDIARHKAGQRKPRPLLTTKRQNPHRHPGKRHALIRGLARYYTGHERAAYPSPGRFAATLSRKGRGYAF